jgi:hypothetical protein
MFDGNRALFCDTKTSNENRYWDARGKMNNTYNPTFKATAANEYQIRSTKHGDLCVVTYKSY